MNTKTEEVLLRTSLQDCREKYDKLSKEYLELAAALVAKDEALDKYRGQIDRFGNHTAADALAIKPHAALVAKIKADAVREFGFGKAISHYANAHADRIERGEV